MKPNAFFVFSANQHITHSKGIVLQLVTFYVPHFSVPELHFRSSGFAFFRPFSATVRFAKPELVYRFQSGYSSVPISAICLSVPLNWNLQNLGFDTFFFPPILWRSAENNSTKTFHYCLNFFFIVTKSLRCSVKVISCNYRVVPFITNFVAKHLPK